MQITIRNLTGENITVHQHPETHKFNVRRIRKQKAPDTAHSEAASDYLVEPMVDFSTILPKGFRRELVLREVKGDEFATKEWHIHPEGLRIGLSLALSATWQVVSVPDGCPWRIYIARVTRRHHKLFVMEKRDMSSYLSLLPDRLPMSSVALPGTHDTMARYGWPISQCQNVSLTGQLRAGIRVIDIRLAVIPPPIRSAESSTLTAAPNQRLIAYHGIYPQQTPFDDILNDVYQFLSNPASQRETVIMSIKQEDGQITPAAYFATAVRQAITSGSGGWNEDRPSQPGVNRGMWFLENRIPTLGEVRGKVVMFSRFGGDGSAWPEGFEGIGIHPLAWPDSRKEGFEWELKGTRVRTQDWYAIPSFMSIPEKMQRGTANLVPPQPLTQPLLPITYFSAASFPLSLPPVIAKGFGMPKLGFGIEGVNSRLGKWLLDQIGGISPPTIANEGAKQNDQDVKEEPRIRGWTFLDYFADPEEGQVVPLLVECNFLGRKAGEEGW